MQEYQIAADECQQANKAELTGKLYGIDIGYWILVGQKLSV